LLAGTPDMRYDKHHLVPFGEFVPPGFRWFVDAMTIPLGDFNRGAQRQALFNLHGQVLAPNICYEDVFGEEIIQSVRPSQQFGAGATNLVNASNLGWFGDSWALRQHLQISRMRALETARPMIRATNTGMTAAIDPNGVVRAVLPAHSKGVLDVEVQGTTGLTPYVRWGNTPVLTWTALLLLLGLALRGRRPQKGNVNTDKAA
jgi:apolipoprotein N-acyltransferase